MRESSENNPISEEEQLIGRRFSVEDERGMVETSPSDDVAEMHKVICELLARNEVAARKCRFR